MRPSAQDHIFTLQPNYFGHPQLDSCRKKAIEQVAQGGPPEWDSRELEINCTHQGGRHASIFATTPPSVQEQTPPAAGPPAPQGTRDTPAPATPLCQPALPGSFFL